MSSSIMSFHTTSNIPITMLLFLFILFLYPHLILSAPFPSHTTCSRYRYANGSPLQSNLDKLLPDLPNAASQNGSLITWVGQGTDRIYGLAICLAGMNYSNCHTCLELAVRNLSSTMCSYSTSAVSWYDHCMVHYSRKDFRNIPQTNHSVHDVWGYSEANGGGLETVVDKLVMDLSNSAANNTQVLFAVDEVRYPLNNSSNITISGLAQCTRDLSADNCARCLANFTGTLETYSRDKTYTGAFIVGESCFIWYDQQTNPGAGAGADQDQINSENDSSPPPGPRGESPLKTFTITACSIGIGIAFILIIIAVWRCKIASSRNKKISMNICFTFNQLKNATKNFDPSNILGRGGFGRVYQGLLDKTPVAIKELTKATKENEAQLIKQLSDVLSLHHQNILKLLGYCFEESKYFFVYELMPNGGLDKHLTDSGRQTLEWRTRFQIIKDIADGLAYLHNKKIIHADLKPANILLNNEMRAKVADFDMLRTLATDQTHQSSEHVAGTRGYMAPEIFWSHRYSMESDVYSFGIMVLEIVTGKSIYNGDDQSEEDLINYIWTRWNGARERYGELMDACLDVQNQTEFDRMVKCIHIGLLCIQYDAAERPSIWDVLKMLNKERVNLETPSMPFLINGDRTQVYEPATVDGSGSRVYHTARDRINP